MRVVLSDLLTERAEGVEPDWLDPGDLVAEGRRAARRRQRLSMAAAAVVTAIALGATSLVLALGGDDRIAPAPPAPAFDEPGQRPLTYGLGQTIHLDDRSIDTGMDFLTLDVVDGGAAFTTLDGGIWVTDGSAVEQIGATSGGNVFSQGVSWPHGRPPGWVQGDEVGSLLAWLEYPDGRDPELVVHDARTGLQVGRYPIGVPGGDSERPGVDDPSVDALIGGRVYVQVAWEGNELTVLEVDATTGVTRTLTRAEYLALGSAPGRPRTLLDGGPRGPVLGAGTPYHELATGRLSVSSGILVGDSSNGLFDGFSGEALRIRLPDRFEGGGISLLQWLDDDRIVLMHGAPGLDGDLLVCRLSIERCEVAVEAEDWPVEPITPGFGGAGNDLAMGAAINSAS